MSAGDAYETIRRAALEAVERRRARPDDVTEVLDEVRRVVDEYQAQASRGRGVPLGEPARMVERILRSIVDLGPLSDLVARDDVEEIFFEGARVSYLDARGRLRGLTVPTSEEENRRILDRLLAATERQLTTKSPMVQARVLRGTARLTAAIPPVADRLSATIRRYTVRDASLGGLVDRGTLSAEAARFLDAVVQARTRLVISGEPGAGKTTMLAALLRAVPAAHCVRCCEEIRELAVALPHGACYEVRAPAADGSGEITLRDLVRFVLGMRPDRIVVGEVRGAEAFELTRAVNAGCGFCCTVHANRATDALDALVNAALMAGENVTEGVVRKVLVGSIDLVVHLERAGAAGGERRVREITAVVPALTRGITCEPVFARAGTDGALEWTGALPEALEARVDCALGPGRTLREVVERAAVPA